MVCKAEVKSGTVVITSVPKFPIPVAVTEYTPVSSAIYVNLLDGLIPLTTLATNDGDIRSHVTEVNSAATFSGPPEYIIDGHR